MVLAAGKPPQSTVISAGAVMVGKAAGLIVIVLVFATNALPHTSVAVHVSVTVPPQAVAGIAEKVELFDVPLIRHPPAAKLV